MNEPKPVDPNVDPNATPPEGGKTLVGEEMMEVSKKQFGDGENEKGELRKTVLTKEAEVNFWKAKAQENSQPAPQTPEKVNIEVPNDLMEEGAPQKFFDAISTKIETTRQETIQDIRNEAALAKGDEQIKYLMDKYNVSYDVAVDTLRTGYKRGANTPEEARHICGEQYGSLFGQSPTNTPPSKGSLPPNQIKYPVTPPTVPTGGEDGSDSSKIKAPSGAEYEAMTPEEKRDLDKKIIAGKVEFNSDHAKFSTHA